MSLVSIIIPCFNDGRFLMEAVESARCQTHHEIEIIVVDDHSDDSLTLNVLVELRQTGKVTVLVNQGARGPAAARNLGIAHAAGQYILPLDSDDLIHPTYAAKAADVLDSNADVGICYCRAKFFGRRKGIWRLPQYSWEMLLFENMIFVSAMFRKADWQRIGGFDESLAMANEDHAFWLSLIDNKLAVYQIDEVLFSYRFKRGSRATVVNRDPSVSALALFNSKRELFDANAASIYLHGYQLRREIAIRQSLFVEKLVAPLSALELRLRRFIKSILR